MGCSWAVYCCQDAHLSLLRQGGVIDPPPAIRDFIPPPGLESPACSIYLDNGIYLGINAVAVDD
eukprot:539028-Karenia_brevis.AAC.1